MGKCGKSLRLESHKKPIPKITNYESTVDVEDKLRVRRYHTTRQALHQAYRRLYPSTYFRKKEQLPPGGL